MSSDPRHPPLYLRVAIPSPLYQLFDYLPDDGKCHSDYPVGSRVRVPFGRRQLIGIILAHSSNSTVSASQLRTIEQVLDTESLLPQSLLELAQWISDYYHHPPGDTLFNLLPNQLKKSAGSSAYTRRCWQVTTHGLALPDSALPRAPKQQALLNTLKSQPEQWLCDDQLRQAGHKVESALQLHKKGLARQSQQTYLPEDCASVLQALKNTPALNLNCEQQQALDELLSIGQRFDTLLLEGITGSGKTEVYLQAIANVLARQQQVIVLVPEIGLTPQTIERFTRRFDCKIAVFHSGLSDRERLAAWQAARTGAASIIIGTRSAVFTPLACAGLIIVDEEHDGSYKQQEGLRYSARDVAIMRGRLESIPVVLGSATPSLETLGNAMRGRYRHSLIRQRAGTATPPTIEFIDIRRLPLHEGFSDRAIQAIRQTLDNRQQAMVFINRRGFAPLLMCHDCGWQASCEHCDARLTLHQRDRQLRCHHCDSQMPLPVRCPHCLSGQLQRVGQGTERSSLALEKLFPGTSIVRIDRDTTVSRHSLSEHIDLINKDKPLIMVGTQMLAKGHHFRALQTVVMLDIDQGLYSPDFRGPEKTLQLTAQVAGRAGRAGQPGQVLIQTHLPDHPLIQAWAEQGYQGVSAELLSERELRSLPPYSYQALIRADSTASTQALQFLQTLLTSLEPLKMADVQVIGPLPAMMEKRAGRHRAQILLMAARRKSLHQTVDTVISLATAIKKPTSLRWSIDVDPQDPV